MGWRHLAKLCSVQPGQLSSCTQANEPPEWMTGLIKIP